jgi:hypothetical protein
VKNQSDYSCSRSGLKIQKYCHCSTVIAELRSNLSTDRLKRVKDASAISRSQNSSTSTDSDVGLFNDCAFHFPANVNKFIIGRVQRMRKKGTRGLSTFAQLIWTIDRPLWK